MISLLINSNTNSTSNVQQQQFQSCQILAYNVANLAKSIEFGNFITFLNKYIYIFFLFETHVIENKQKMFEIYFKNFTLSWITAKKTHCAGRPSGGCLFGFKNEIKSTFMLKFCNVFDNVVLSAQFNGEKFYLIVQVGKKILMNLKNFCQTLNQTISWRS